MKIYVFGKKNFLYWDNHVVDAFKTLGHETRHFQYNNRKIPLKISHGLLKAFLGKSKANQISNYAISENLKREIENFKPDLIFLTHACFIPLEFYQMLHSLNIETKIFAWEGDGGSNVQENKKLVPYIDILFETDLHYIAQNKLNFKQIEYLPFCSNTQRYKNFDTPRENKTYFCGNLAYGRDEVFSSLTDFNFVLRGWNWDKLSKKSNRFDIKKGTIGIEQQIKDYNKYYSVINIHQKVNHICALNMRTFEVPSCGALLVNDYREGLEQLFDIKNEIIVYNSVDELREIIYQIQKFPNDFQSIVNNGYKRVHNEHTYVHRMKKVLQYL